MSSISKQKLSGSTNGKPVKVVGTATGSATTIHTATSGTTDWDEIWIYGFNSDASSVLLTIEYGGATDPDSIIEVTLESQVGLVLLIPGLILQNSAVIKAFAATGNVITLSGWVNRIDV